MQSNVMHCVCTQETSIFWQIWQQTSTFIHTGPFILFISMKHSILHQNSCQNFHRFSCCSIGQNMLKAPTLSVHIDSAPLHCRITIAILFCAFCHHRRYVKAGDVTHVRSLPRDTYSLDHTTFACSTLSI